MTAAAPGLLSDYNSPTPRGVPYNWLWGYFHGAAAIQPVDKVYAAKAILARFDAGMQINADWTWAGVPAYVITYKADLLREFGGGSRPTRSW